MSREQLTRNAAAISPTVVPVDIVRDNGVVPEARTARLAWSVASGSAADTPYANAGQAPHSLVARRNGDERPVTASAFAAQVTPVAKVLIIAGLEPGGRIAIMPRTRYEWAGPDFAVRAAGGQGVPNDAGSSPDQIEWIVRRSGARHLIAESAERRGGRDGLRAG